MKQGKIYTTLILLTALFLSVTVSTQATVKLPRLIGNGMVLQRDIPLQLWGWASPNESIVIKYMDKSYQTKADKNGDWKIALPAQNAGGPYTMQINDIQINDVLIGDVWLCSGQSNMELPIRRVMDLYADEVKQIDNPHIRQFRVQLHYNFNKEETDVQGGEWKSATQANILDFSATAYFFAKDLYDRYGVPVGIINTGVGGSPAEAWVSKEGLKDYPHYLDVARICANPAYIDSVRNAESQRNNQWHTTLNREDKGVGKWNKENIDVSDWGQISLPGYWADKGVGQVNGSLWFRKDFDVTASMAGKQGVLRLGCIVDADSAFINGTFVGTISYQYPPRIYNIPAGLLKEGKNNVTVRVISNGGRGGFVEEKPYKIIVGKESVDLTGDWYYKIGAKMSPAGSQTFFQYKPMGLYNGMIAPLKNYGLKGFLWYQGEANAGKAKEYEALLTALIYDWRAKWNNLQMPFIYAQLPNFMKSRKAPSESGWAELREAQRQTLKTLYTGMAVTIDAGEWNDIHPLNKKTVGQRLALEAQRVAYKDDKIVSTGPVYESIQAEENSIILTFSSVGSGLYANSDLGGFAIAGADKKYVWADAVVLSNNKVRVWNRDIENPVFVRYAWADNPEGANLRNKEGLPASPFQAEFSDILTANSIGIHDGYNYELWHDRGNVSMVLKKDGAFACKWNGINNALFRTGKKFDVTKTFEQIGNISLSFDSDYKPVGNSYLCVYGWSIDPLVEFYVVEAWGTWRPPGAKSKGTVKIDGGTYDIYETTRVEQPSILGNTTFKQYWSVRTDKKTKGTVSVSEHFKAWEKAGMKLGKIYEVALCVEGYQSEGTADIYNHILTIGDTDSKK
jgi:sialate O-acetylesterase